MEYRTLPHGGEKISVIGIGAASLDSLDTPFLEKTIRYAIDAGINHFDFIPSDACAFEGFARALRGSRDKVHIQIHMGAEYHTGKYGWTVDPKVAIPEFEKRLKTLQTDYADFGFIHCVDEASDLDKIMNGGLWDYALKRKADGTIRHLAFSTHTTSIARRLIKTGEFDLAMFSINPMYDYTDESAYGKGEVDDRMSLYREFEQAGIGVSVMKAFAGGQLLDAAQSPFGIGLTTNQCIQYALDRPAVLTVIPGIRSRKDLDELLSYLDSSPEERDYSILGSVAPRSVGGSCVYCNHCQPCPQGLSIGLINKYYDLARLGDELAADHYRTLDLHAGDCVQCGHCDDRCPFGVAQGARMEQIAAFFGV